MFRNANDLDNIIRKKSVNTIQYFTKVMRFGVVYFNLLRLRQHAVAKTKEKF